MFDFRFGTIASDPNSQSDLTLASSLARSVDKVFAQSHPKRTTAFEVSEIQIAMQFAANGRALVCPLQHRQATLFVGLPPPAPQAWPALNSGSAELETATRFPALHFPNGGYLDTPIAAQH